MDSKLKALKVVDLKAILSEAQVPLQGKANKADLINKILASPQALTVYQTNYLASPSQPEPTPSKSNPELQPPSSSDPPPPEPSPPKSTEDATPTDPEPSTSTAPPPTEVDAELERRKARAARFGIPLVEPKPPKSSSPRAAATAKAPKIKDASPTRDPEKLAARAARFGLPAATPAAATPAEKSKKRAAPVEVTDPEELERRKKRAERFNASTATAKT